MSEASTLARPLLPAPVQGLVGAPGGGSGGGSLPPNERREPKQKRAQISVACEVCRKRKAKCDGIRPSCTPCQTRQLDCNYGADPDATRMATLKRKHQVLTDRNYALESLFTHLRDASSIDAGAAFDCIRNGISVDDILSTTHHPRISREIGSEDHDSGPPSPTALQVLDDSSESRRSNSFSSVRDRMNVHALLAADSASDTPNEAQVPTQARIPHRGRILSPHRHLTGRAKKG